MLLIVRQAVLADVPALARHFLARSAAEEGKRIRAITSDALRLLVAYHWPGNIRQLENAVFRAVVLADGDTLGIEEFPQISAQLSGTSFPSPKAEVELGSMDDRRAETLTAASIAPIAGGAPLSGRFDALFPPRGPPGVVFSLIGSRVSSPGPSTLGF